jgi:hypothetical protein
MTCEFCQTEAVTRCHACGALVCAEHGKGDICPHCATGFLAGNPRAVAISKEPLAPIKKAGWWRPQKAEEYVPPACYQCQGIGRGLCHNCQSHFCPEHAGPNGLCRDCARSANLGIYVFVGLFLLAMVLFLCHLVFGR